MPHANHTQVRSAGHYIDIQQPALSCDKYNLVTLTNAEECVAHGVGKISDLGLHSYHKAFLWVDKGIHHSSKS